MGDELERITQRAKLDFVKYFMAKLTIILIILLFRYIAFDFHGECKALNWDRLSILRDWVRKDIQEFG